MVCLRAKFGKRRMPVHHSNNHHQGRTHSHIVTIQVLRTTPKLKWNNWKVAFDVEDDDDDEIPQKI